MTTERLTKASTQPREGHEFRYRLANGFAWGGCTILDAACGTGYGEALMPQEWKNYYGVDIAETAGVECGYGEIIRADLTTWQPDFDYDLFVSFETIEHLADYDNLIAIAKRAGRWAIMSVPVVPTKHENPHHLHDFEPGDLERLMVDDDWRHYQTVQQPSESSEIAVFQRVPS